MKNTFKLGALALALTVSFASCSGKKSTSAADSTAKADSIAKAAAPGPDTAKHDTTKVKGPGPDTLTKKK